MTETAESPHQPAGDSGAVFNVPAVVLSLIGLLVAIHFALWVLGPDWQVWSLYAFSFVPSRLGGGVPVPYPQGAQVWSFLTYALLHGDVYHLASNCIWLLIFSTPLAKRLGTNRYLVLICVCAVAGAAAMLPLHWGQFLIVVGASASVSGAMAAAIPVMFAPGFHRGADPKAVQVMTFMELITSRQAVFFTAVFVGLQLLSGSSQALNGTAFLEERSIAWEAHLGGFIAGLILFYLLDKSSRSVSP